MTETPAVKAMMDTKRDEPTAPLWEFVEAYQDNDNLWWYLECGHHQNLFESAIEMLEQIQEACNDSDMYAGKTGGGFVTTERIREIIFRRPT